MAYNPLARYSDNIHSDPLYRKPVRSLHPVEAAGFITAQSYGGRRGHATRYVILNEHEPRKKLLRSATRIPRHFLMEEPAEILELYPRNVKRYAHRATHHHQPHPHRSHPSQQHLSEEEEEEEGGKSRRRVSMGKAHRPHSLSDLHQPAHFYIGERVESHVSVAKDSHAARGRYAAEEEDEDGGGDIDWRDLESHSRSQASVKGADHLLVRTRRHVPSPARHCQSPVRTRHAESHVKLKARPKLETPLTESDSASLASSSDQQNSSTDQYIQVIHNKERCLKSDARQGKPAKKKSKAGCDLNVTDSKDLVCSNV
ncbi:putative transmembrane channel-like protein 3 [Scophthalmus maximus]|uniref:Putative transmembrane channel-like protein 3 n=2 Tax=Scophthalmus maximus TaxID=52904 RepID=A0A2U9BDQ7_SCOMX|nr:putative transmembrane channel-like protein 3 [Scophthalmus maximus]